MQHKNTKIIVIGAGPAGLAAAYELAKAGIKVEVFEASNHVGGMARSFDLFDQRVDCGPHRFFSTIDTVNQFFKELVGKDFTLVNRLTRIYYKKRFFYYPLKLMNVLTNLNIFQITSILYHYGYQQVFPIKNPKTFEDWVVNKFGRKLFNIFFKNYSEKLWGIPCSKIDADFAAQRIKKLSLYEAVKSAVFGDKNNKHKTLVDQFAYPEGGTGTIYERAADYINQNGGKVHLNRSVRKVLLNDKGEAIGVKLLDGTEQYADQIISSMPLTLLVKGLDNVPKNVVAACDKLYFRNTILVYLEVNHDDLFPDNWVYIHSPEVKHGRITNFRNWSPSLCGNKKTTILCLEYWAFPEDEIWSAADNYLTDLGTEELRTINLLPKDVKVLNKYVLRIPKCYPVYETGYRDNVKVIANYLTTIPRLIPIGRYGAFKYNNQDHSILMGLLAARQIANNEEVDLWAINTDTEYQEGAKVEEMVGK